MLCDSCGKRNAIIAYTKMKETGVEIVHLCSTCAEEKMREDLDFNNVVTEKVGNFIDELFKFIGKSDRDIEEKTCPNCNTSLKEIIEDKKVGCESCYDTFKDEIENLLINLQTPTVHKGKIPKSAGKKSVEKREEVELLNKLNVAIELEEYEEAAKLRDRIKALKEG